MEAQLTGLIFSDAELRAWLAGGGLRGIDHLIVWDANLTDVGASAVAESADAEHVANLDLSWNHVGAVGVGALLRLARLVRLRLYHDDVGPAGAAVIAERGEGLEMLNLCGNGLGNAGVQALARGSLRGVRDLALGWNELADVAPLTAGGWDVLARLNVRANRLDARAVGRLLDGSLPALRELGLDENPLGDAGIAALVAAPGYAQLAWLNLGGTELDDRAALRIAARGPTALRHLRVHDNELAPLTIATLRRALPDCEIHA